MEDNGSVGVEAKETASATTEQQQQEQHTVPVQDVTQMRNIDKISLGRYFIRPWYFSPYPKEITHLPIIYICDFCLKYTTTRFRLKRHLEKCCLKHPPGKEIYRSGENSFFEIDGRKNKRYSENLCLLAKLFLDHKNVEYDTEPFLFYVLTEATDYGHHIVGYFSKEKVSKQEYNLACILTLPPYQRRGFGKLLIEFSYELSKLENKMGSPEKPLSDLGLLSYRAYWSETVMEVILSSATSSSGGAPTSDSDEENTNDSPYITINGLIERTAINTKDLVATLHTMKVLFYKNGHPVIVITKSTLENFQTTLLKRKLRIDPSKIQWKPVDWVERGSW